MMLSKPRTLRDYVQRKRELHGIRRALFSASHPILEAAVKLSRKEHNDALSESESRYSSIFQNNHTVMLLVDLEKWSIVDANPAACAFYGYEKGDLVGKSISDINLLDKKELSERLAEAMQKPRTKFYFSHRIADGRMRDVEVHTGPITLDGKQLLYSIIHDVTEQKRIERMIKRHGEFSALRAEIWSTVWSDRNISEEDLIKKVMDRLGQFTNSDPIIFFRVDRRNGNAVAELEWGKSGIVEPSAGKMIPKFILAEHHGEKVIDISSQTVFCDKKADDQGNQSASSFLLVPYGDENNPEGYFAFGEKMGKRIWERREKGLLNEMSRILFTRIEQMDLESRLRQHEKLEALGRLAGGIAHDFNNMLTGILGYAELLKGNESLDPQTLQHAEMISTSAKRMASLTQKLLAFARKGKYSVQTLAVHDIIDEAVSVLERGIEDKNINLIRKFNADNCCIEGDEGLVYNALLNLGLNARDAMPNGGGITFETRNVNVTNSHNHLGLAVGNHLVITVRDSGIGMSEETRRKAFEPFFTTKGVGKGIGLGLASVYGTVKSHHGQVEIRSKVGKGTVVEIYLPVSDKIREKIEEAPKEPVQGHGTVLVVDDESIVRGVVANLLDISGYDVRQCSNGAEAIEFYAKNWQGIDLVMIDMKMPGLDGKACFRELRKINPSIKAMLMTGYSLDEDAKASMDEGMVDYIPKPFEIETLVRTIQKHIKEKK